MQGNRRLFSFTAASIVTTGILLTGAALATFVSSSSTALLRIDTRTNNGSVLNPQTTTSPTFVNLTGASVPISIASGNRLIRTRFTAEGKCESIVGNGCMARVVATNTATLATIELDPQSSTEFNFVPPNGLAGGYAMDRSRRITAGSYNIKVQFAAGAGSLHTLDDWHFTVETFQ